MPKFKLIRQERVTIWHQYTVDVEAPSEEEAIKLLSPLRNWDKIRMKDHVGISDISTCTAMFDTELAIAPTIGKPTVKILIDDDERDEDNLVELYNNDPCQFDIGDMVEVPDPNLTNVHQHSFVGEIIGFEGEYALVKDGDNDVFDIEPERLKLHTDGE